MAAAATTAVRNQRIARHVGTGPRYTAVPDGESAFSPLIMRTTTVGPGGKYRRGKEARHTPQRLEGLARAVAKFQATNGEELKQRGAHVFA